ncbi:MAG: hypothetical protein NTU80_13115 [Verrucomicrobia bacterium]|nr:hypothetical protein [Verrucomicrobiota bacterium]
MHIGQILGSGTVSSPTALEWGGKEHTAQSTSGHTTQDAATSATAWAPLNTHAADIATGQIQATRAHRPPRSATTLAISSAQNTWNDGSDTAPKSARPSSIASKRPAQPPTPGSNARAGDTTGNSQKHSPLTTDSTANRAQYRRSAPRVGATHAITKGVR